jgi:hypothetical protein
MYGCGLQELLADSDLPLGVINWKDFLGWTPLIYAAFHGDFELVKLVRTPAPAPSPFTHQLGTDFVAELKIKIIASLNTTTKIKLETYSTIRTGGFLMQPYLHISPG